MGDSDPAITLRFTSSDARPLRPVDGTVVFESDPLRMLETYRGFQLVCGETALDINVSGGHGEGVLDDSFWDHPLQYQRQFFLLSLLMLMRPFGLYGLHANCVSNDTSGCLIVGNSGAGKTSLALSLIKQGWNYLSDDAVMVRRSGDGVEAQAFRLGFSLTPETVCRFPELGSSHAFNGELRNGKRAMDIELVFPGQRVQSCSPQLIVFPEISGRAHSELVPVSRANALTRLFEQSPGFMVDKPLVSKQLEALTLLIDQTRSYQILVGTDIFDKPEAVSKLLMEAQRG